jgi:hypothetical protein
MILVRSSDIHNLIYIVNYIITGGKSTFCGFLFVGDHCCDLIFSSALFAMLDKKDYGNAIWKLIERTINE